MTVRKTRFSAASRERASKDVPGAKRFSIIVPVYQHWELMPKLLDCIQHQTLPAAQFEMILVDNGSADFTPPANIPQNVQVLRCDTPGSYAARNYGARYATGEWLVFTDSDCLPSPQWLQKLDEAATRSDNASMLLAGAVEIVSSSERPGSYEIYDMVKGIPQSRYVSRGYAATANLAVPRSVFDQLGGFDDKRFSGGDADFCRRAGAQGHPIMYLPQARVDHPARVTWEEISTKARRIKGGQLAAGTRSHRRKWMLATLVPPVRGVWHFFRSTRHPLNYRLIAILVLLQIWVVELKELVRLSFGGKAERT